MEPLRVRTLDKRGHINVRPGLFQAAARDPEVFEDDGEIVVPAIVDEIEVYYQNTPSLLTPSVPTSPSDVISEAEEFFLNLWGEAPLPGVFPQSQVRYHDLTGIGVGHSDVHEYYQSLLEQEAEAAGSPVMSRSAGAATAESSTPAPDGSPVPGRATPGTVEILQQESDPEVDLLYPALVDDRGVAEQLVAVLGEAMQAHHDGTLRIAIENLSELLDIVQRDEGVHIAPELALWLDFFGRLVVEDFQTTFETASPVMAPIDDRAVDEGTTLTFTAAATDPNPEDTLSFSLDVAPPGATIDQASGLFTWTPPEGPAIAEVTVRVTDSGTPRLSDIARFTITVNNVPPAIDELATSAMVPGDAGTDETVTLNATFTDPGVLDTHTAIIAWGDGTTGAAVIDEVGGSGSISGTHAYGAGGLYAVTVTLADDDGGTTTAVTSAVITGAGVNDGVLQIVGTEGDDNVAVNMSSRDLIKVHASFLPEPGFEVFSADGIETILILLGDGNDHATVSGGVSLTTVIDGGRGNDFLNGGSGANILLGGDGPDKLLGGPASDILIGGAGRDKLVGGPGDDILIAGRTTLDPDEQHFSPGFDQALLAVLADWNLQTRYEERVASPRPRIVALDDEAADVLVGGAGRDWFFAQLGTLKRDEIRGGQPDEFVEPVA